MKRNVNLDEISDGKLYGTNDLVKAGCSDCTGCFACCTGMGSSIVLDPLDISRMVSGVNCTFEDLLTENLELNVVDGIILPNLKMAGEEEKCTFLNAVGRCSIHIHRPGICRLFPLGRLYENNSFSYILQVHECRKESKTKVKVKKWIDTPDVKRYERFINDWHYFLNELSGYIISGDEAFIKRVSMYILNNFYINTIEYEDFYSHFDNRLETAKKELGQITSESFGKSGSCL